MILKVYSVLDTAAGAFLQPFFAPTDGIAIRSFMEAVNDSNHQFSKHALDYTLFLLGSFDDVDGAFKNETQTPVKLLSALEAQMKFVDNKV